jgi:hypothetical protein
MRLAFSCVLCFFLSNIYAQTSKWDASINLGVAVPVGKFGSKNISDSLSAFAKAGPALNLEVSYQFSRYIGFSMLLNGQQNEVDTKKIADKLNEAYPTNYFAIGSGDWNIGKIMGGINLSLPIDNHKKLSFTARIMAGALKTTVPKSIIYEDYYDPGTGFNTQSLATVNKHPLEWTFACLAGFGFKYDVYKNFFVQSNFDYSASSPDAPKAGTRRPTVITTLPYDPQIPLYPAGSFPTYKQPINSVNFCLGIGLNF